MGTSTDETDFPDQCGNDVQHKWGPKYYETSNHPLKLMACLNHDHALLILILFFHP